jgi:hypothetical protein
MTTALTVFAKSGIAGAVVIRSAFRSAAGRGSMSLLPISWDRKAPDSRVDIRRLQPCSPALGGMSVVPASHHTDGIAAAEQGAARGQPPRWARS